MRKLLISITFGIKTSRRIRNIIWKYLQLILFSIAQQQKNVNMFGETANLFQGIGEDDLEERLKSTMESISNMFGELGKEKEGKEGKEGLGDAFQKMAEAMGNMGFDNEDNSASAKADSDDEEDDNSPFPGMDFMKNLPDPTKLKEHLSGLMEGKIGQLATQIAEEASNDILHEFVDLNEEETKKMKPEDIFKKLLSNPEKFKKIIMKIGKKIEQKIKSGEIKESELMEEASEMINKLGMSGMKDIKKMMSKMGMDMGGKGKMNLGAMKSKLNGNLRQSKMKEKMLEKLKKRREAQARAQGAMMGKLANKRLKMPKKS